MLTLRRCQESPSPPIAARYPYCIADIWQNASPDSGRRRALGTGSAPDPGYLGARPHLAGTVFLLLFQKVTGLDNQPSRLFLVGPMGAGKSTVGRRLAEALGLRFHDLDDILSRRAGATIADIFEIEGEPGFRRREAVLLDEYTRLPGCVLATGGGCVVNPENRELLSERGFVVYLKTPVDLQLKRLRHDIERPLLQAPDRRKRLEGLAAERNPLYESVADLVVEPGDRSPSESCDRILARLPGGIGTDRASGAGP